MSTLDKIAILHDIDEACDRFEEELRANKKPQIESFLSPWQGEERAKLLEFLVAVESEYLLESGVVVNEDDYKTRFPNDTIPLADVFASTTPSKHAGLDDTIGNSKRRSTNSLDAAAQNAIEFLSLPEQPDELGKLGEYRVLELIGVGGMGVVFRAKDPRLERIVAVKVMRSELAADENARERFIREAKAMASLEHDNVVTIHQVAEERQVPFIAMHFLKGESLKSRLQRASGPLNEEQVLRIGREVADGLSAAHEQGLIHRDIKPDNIWLEAGRDRVKILDFGLAHVCDGDEGLTQSGMLLGTPKYMAPEQTSGKSVDHRCDLFSLGALMYHMVTGVTPFDGDSLMSVLAAVARCEYEPIASKANVDTATSKLIDRLLSKSPDDRPASALEVVEAITTVERQLATRAPAQADALPSIQPVARPRNLAKPIPISKNDVPVWRSPLVLLGILLPTLLLLAGVVVYFQTNNGTLRVEVNDPDIEVSVKGTQFLLKQGDEENDLRLTPGDHILVVQRGDFKFETDKLVLKRGDDVTVKVELLAGKIEVRQGSTLIGSDKLPARSQLQPPPIDNVVQPSATPNTQPVATPTSQTNREVAEWILSEGGLVNDATTLPEGDNWRIRFVNLRGESVTDANLKRIKTLHYLEDLRIEHTAVTGSGFGSLPSKNLRALSVGGTPLCAEAYEHITGFKNLEYLSIGTGGEALSIGLQRLRSLPELKVLGLRDATVSADAIASLKEIKQLEHLELTNDVLSRGAIDNIATLPMVKTLVITAQQLAQDDFAAVASLSTLLNLHVSGAPDSGQVDGIEFVVKLTSLHSLTLDTNPLNDDSLAKLSQLTNARRIELRGCPNVTDVGIARLKKALPNCTVIVRGS